MPIGDPVPAPFTALEMACSRIEEYVRVSVYEAMRPATERGQWAPECLSSNGPIYLRQLLQDVVRLARAPL